MRIYDNTKTHRQGALAIVALTLLAFMAGFIQESEAASKRRRGRRAKPTEEEDAIGHQPMALENTYRFCTDGLDNDSDSYVDCDDQDCLLFAVCADASAETSSEQASPADLSQEIAAADTGEEEVIDLDSLDEEESASPPPAAGGHPGHGGGASKPPKFKLFFDLLTEYEFDTKKFQFTRDHAHVMMELSAADWLSFRADIAFEPEFYEAIFHIGTVAEFRLGKVLVPFGQNEFHHLIGGRVDEDSLFLPTVWGDYGLAFKHDLYSGDVVSFDYSIWAINGFGESVGREGNPEPSRSDGNLEDNNQMKGVGFRPQLHIGTAVTIGSSWYFDAWDTDSDEDSGNEEFMLFYGVDISLGYDLIKVPVLKNIRLRVEAAWAEIKLPGRNAYHGIFSGEANGIMPNFGTRRSGYNIELSYRILPWLFFRYREGLLNDDNRWTDNNDLLIHEPGMVAVIGPVQLSLVGQIHQRLASDAELEENGDPDEPNHSRLIFRMLFRY